MIRLIKTSMCIEVPVTVFAATDAPVTIYDAALLTPLGQSTHCAERGHADIVGRARRSGWRVLFAGVELWGAVTPGSRWILLDASSTAA